MTRQHNDQFISVIVIGGSPAPRCRVTSRESGCKIPLVTTSGLLDLFSYVDL